MSEENESAFGRLRRQLQVYRVFVFWLFGEMRRNFGRQLVAIGVASFLANTAQAAAFGAGLLYVDAIERDTPITLLGLSVPVESSLCAILIVAATVLELCGNLGDAS